MGSSLARTATRTAALITGGLTLALCSVGASAALIVTKTASTSFIRTYQWAVTKTAAPSEVTLPVGGSKEVQFTIGIELLGTTDSGWIVSGIIDILNDSTSAAATLSGVSDIISPDIAAAVNCPIAIGSTIAAGATVTCTYSASLPDASTRTNTATVVSQDTIGGTATVPVDFANALIVEVNKTVTADDDALIGETFQTTASTSFYTYGREFFGSEPGNYSFTNTVTLLETGQSASATVNITVVPEPGTLALLGLGLAGLAATRRRKQQ